MAIYGYTKNYKLIKPQFDTDTWHDYVYDNLDTIDAIMSAIYSSGNWQGFWKKNTHYNAGDVVIDQDTDTMYKVLVEHTTSENTFALEQAAHPTYYELWSPNDLAESWAIKMDGLVDYTDYSSKAYAISSELIDDGSAKEWAIKTDNSIGTTGEYSAKKHATDAASSASTAISQASAASASATLAQQWAIDANLVASTDYSSKSWATGSLDAGSAKDWAIKEGGQVGTTGKYSAKVYSLAAENHYEKARDWASKTNGQVESTDYSSKAYAISEGLIPDGSAKEWSNKAKAWATSTSIVEDGKYGASYYALQAYNANVSAQAAKITAQEWASKTDGQVASTDYSSKAYAQSEGLISSGSSKEWATKSSTWAEGSDADVAVLGGTHSSKTWAEQAAISAAGTKFKLFQHQWFDYAVNDLSWLRADTFSWQDGTAYSNAYDHLVADIDGITANTETVGGYTVTFYRATDGHKIVLADQETTVSNIYTATGVAWYYVLDTDNTRFKLPRTKYGFDGLRGNVGDYISESLPNITGRTSGIITCTGTGEANGALYDNDGVIYDVGSDGGSVWGGIRWYFDASRSSSTYQNGAPVQERGTQMYLYFYVGQYTQSAIEQTAGLNAELFNDKADIDASNFNAAGKSLISGMPPHGSPA